MRNIILITLFLVIIVSIISCAKTDVSSFKDPEASIQYKRILVGAIVPNIGERQLLESDLVEKLAEQGVTGIPSVSVVLPTRQYTESELQGILVDNNIDAILLLRLTSKDRVTKSYTHNKRNVLEHEWQQVTSIYTIPVLYFTLELSDVKANKQVWIANTKTWGGKYANVNVLIESLANTTVEKLKEDNLL